MPAYGIYVVGFDGEPKGKYYAMSLEPDLVALTAQADAANKIPIGFYARFLGKEKKDQEITLRAEAADGKFCELGFESKEALLAFFAGKKKPHEVKASLVSEAEFDKSVNVANLYKCEDLLKKLNDKGAGLTNVCADLNIIAKTRFLDAEELKHFEMTIKDGKFVWVASGKLVHTHGAKALWKHPNDVRPGYHPRLTNRYIYVMAQDGKMYAADWAAEYAKGGFADIYTLLLHAQKGGTIPATLKLKMPKQGEVKELVGFHHSSFFRGGVAAAGEIQINQGVLEGLSNSSGHFKPELKYLLQFMDEIRAKSKPVIGGKYVSFEHFIDPKKKDDPLPVWVEFVQGGTKLIGKTGTFYNAEVFYATRGKKGVTAAVMKEKNGKFEKVEVTLGEIEQPENYHAAGA
jgi:hypothetical protein